MKSVTMNLDVEGLKVDIKGLEGWEVVGLGDHLMRLGRDMIGTFEMPTEPKILPVKKQRTKGK